ncbi:MAG TPA: FAD-dependent oxidoreductase, partial [Gaiellaceae bacterium]|nr:FAD-dependent oxidoreductase [Gaiellaceae bacterium]
FAVTVHDARAEAGGLVRFAIAPYRQLREPLPDEVAALEELGVEFRFGDAVGSREELRRLEAEADALVLACGLGADTDVDLPGADLPGVWRSLPFIEALKTGETPALGRSVAVIGGGNTAIDVACEARRLGAAEVTLVYRRTEAEMPAYPHEVAEARREGVRFLWLTVPLRFLGATRLDALECRHVRLVPGEGRGRLQEVEGTEFLLPVDTAVLAIGQQPRAELLSWIEGLELERGRPVVDPVTGRTSNPRWWAAGDAVNGGATVVEAVREAKLVAASVAEALS